MSRKLTRSQKQVAWAFSERRYVSSYTLSIDHPRFDEELVIRDAEDPFDILAREEEEQIQINQRNLFGKRKIMTLTNQTPKAQQTNLAAALAPLKDQIIYVRKVGMDPAEILESITSDRLRADVGSSVAWSIDMAIIFRARMVMTELYKKEYDNVPQTREVYEQFMNDFMSLYDSRNEEIFAVSENGKQMLLLIAMREQYHEITGRAMARQLRMYNPPSLVGLMVAEKARAVGENDMAMIAMEIQMMRLEHPELTDEDARSMMADIKMVEQRNYEEQFKDRKRWDRIVMGILEKGQMKAPASAEFHDLSDTVKNTLLTQMVGAVNRAQAWSRRSCKSVSEYMPIAAEVIKVRKAIDATLVSLRDKVEENYRNQQKKLGKQTPAEEDKGREEKAAAAASDAPDFEEANAQLLAMKQAAHDEGQSANRDA